MSRREQEGIGGEPMGRENSQEDEPSREEKLAQIRQFIESGVAPFRGGIEGEDPGARYFRRYIEDGIKAVEQLDAGELTSVEEFFRKRIQQTEEVNKAHPEESEGENWNMQQYRAHLATLERLDS